MTRATSGQSYWTGDGTTQFARARRAELARERKREEARVKLERERRVSEGVVGVLAEASSCARALVEVGVPAHAMVNGHNGHPLRLWMIDREEHRDTRTSGGGISYQKADYTEYAPTVGQVVTTHFTCLFIAEDGGIHRTSLDPQTGRQLGSRFSSRPQVETGGALSWADGDWKDRFYLECLGGVGKHVNARFTLTERVRTIVYEHGRATG